MILLRLRTRRSARNGTTEAEEKPGSIGQDEISADGFIRGFLGLIAFDGKLRSDLHRVFGHTKANQRVRTATFDHPFGDLSIRAFNVDMKPRMRIDHFPLRE